MIMELDRRDFLGVLTVAGGVGLAGCFGSNGENPVGTETATTAEMTTQSKPTTPDSLTQVPTEAQNCSGPDGRDTPTTTAYQDYSAEDALPEPQNGWGLDETTDSNGQDLGAIEGIRGIYTSPGGVRFVVDVIKRRSSVAPFNRLSQRSLAETGWDIGIAYGRFLFAAGTGTYQLTHTPEKPPRLDRTPIPGTEDQSRELLSYSPLLTEEWISNNAFTCGG
jgi:hypothetical protein